LLIRQNIHSQRLVDDIQSILIENDVPGALTLNPKLDQLRFLLGSSIVHLTLSNDMNAVVKKLDTLVRIGVEEKTVIDTEEIRGLKGTERSSGHSTVIDFR